MDAKTRHALQAADRWFKKANAPGDRGCDFLNEDGWDESQKVHALIRAVLKRPSSQGDEPT